MIAGIIAAVVIVAAIFLFRGTGSGPEIGDSSTLPPQMRAAYGMDGKKGAKTSNAPATPAANP